MSIKSKSVKWLLSGSIGNEIWCIRNGKNYKRTKPVSVHNPRTPGQLEQRARFSVMVKFLQPLKDFLRVGFESQAGAMSPFNAAMSLNYKNALSGTYPDFKINYSKVMVSRGNLPGPKQPAVISNIPGKVDFTWVDNSSEYNARGDDMVLLLVYNPDRQEAINFFGGNSRYKGWQSVTLPLSFAGDEVQCYIAFQNAGQSQVSDSQYLGSLRV